LGNFQGTSSPRHSLVARNPLAKGSPFGPSTTWNNRKLSAICRLSLDCRLVIFYGKIGKKYENFGTLTPHSSKTVGPTSRSWALANGIWIEYNVECLSAVHPLTSDIAWRRGATVSIHPHYGFVCGRHDAAWQPRFRNPQYWDLGCLEPTGGRKKVAVFLDAAVQLWRLGMSVHWLLEHKVVTRHCVSLAYDAVKQHRRS